MPRLFLLLKYYISMEENLFLPDHQGDHACAPEHFAHRHKDHPYRLTLSITAS